MAGALAAVAAAALTVAGTVAPAQASPDPAITASNGAVNIAAPGPKDSLVLYRAIDGSPTWNAETVAGRAPPTPTRP
jgi:hypothetical protein